MNRGQDVLLGYTNCPISTGNEKKIINQHSKLTIFWWNISFCYFQKSTELGGVAGPGPVFCPKQGS